MSFSFINRILANPRKRILKNTDTGEVVNVEIQDDEENIIEEGTKLNSETFEEFRRDILDQTRPIGSYFFSEKPDNPNTILGFGTWERVKDGSPFSVIEEDERFSIPGKTFGEVEHTITREELPDYNLTYRGVSWLGGHEGSVGMANSQNQYAQNPWRRRTRN